MLSLINIEMLSLVLLILKAEGQDTNKGAVILTANSRILTFVTSHKSVNYDGLANYTYEDGEDMYFSCKKADKHDLRLSSDPLRLEYYNAEGILLFKTKPRSQQQHIFRSVLKSNNDKYYLDCIRATSGSEREYRYRTTFYTKKRDLHADADQQAMILYVNGRKLTVITNGKTYDYYSYRFIDGEVFNVTCRKTDKNMRGTQSFNGDEVNAKLGPVVRSPLEEYISVNVSATRIHGKKLYFGINNSDVQKPNAVLLLLSDLLENGIYVRGLPRNNILYQYTNDLQEWITEYKYSVNDALNLTCVYKSFGYVEDQRFQWEFSNVTSITAAHLLLPEMTIASNEKFTKILDATHKGKSINCVYIPKPPFKRERVEIILRLEGEAKCSEMISSTANIFYKFSWLTLGSSIGTVFIMLGLTGVACWHMKTRYTRRNIENLYEDLSFPNNSPTPQNTNEWENENDAHYTEILSNGETYYEIPGSVENKKDPEDHYYTEIQQKFMKRKLVVPCLKYDVPSCQ